MNVTKNHLRRIQALEFLTEEMLEKLAPHCELMACDEEHALFREGDLAELFLMLYSGKVLLEKRIAPKITATLYSIKPGQSFGVSALLEPERYQTDAICSEPSELIVIHGDTIRKLLEEDPAMGYNLMKKASMIIYRYLERRTEQFLRSLKSHPDIFDLANPDE